MVSADVDAEVFTRLVVRIWLPKSDKSADLFALAMGGVTVHLLVLCGICNVSHHSPILPRSYGRDSTVSEFAALDQVWFLQ